MHFCQAQRVKANLATYNSLRLILPSTSRQGKVCKAQLSKTNLVPRPIPEELLPRTWWPVTRTNTLGTQDEEKKLSVRPGKLAEPPPEDDLEQNGMIDKVSELHCSNKTLNSFFGRFLVGASRATRLPGRAHEKRVTDFKPVDVKDP